MSNHNNSIALSQNCNGSYLLLVDSDIDDLFYTSILLRRFNYRLHIAKTAREAFIAATTTKPALIVVALDLIDLSGLNFIHVLKKNVSTLDIPIITLRSREAEISDEDCLSAGAFCCLPKPISAEALYRAVQTAMTHTQK